MLVYTYDLLCSTSMWSAHIYTWHTNKSAYTGSEDDKTHLVLRIYPYVFVSSRVIQPARGRRVVEHPFLFLSPLLSLPAEIFLTWMLISPASLAP